VPQVQRARLVLQVLKVTQEQTEYLARMETTVIQDQKVRQDPQE
jgi:hypothetical protein